MASARLTRSTVTSSVDDPLHVSTDAARVLTNVALAMLAVLFLCFPAYVFNSTLAENYDEVIGWFAPLRRNVQRVRGRRGTYHPVMVVGLVSVVGGLLFALLDPHFGANLSSLSLVIGFGFAITAISLVYDISRGRYVARHFRVATHIRGYPLGVVVAALLVLLSRVAHFTPGYLFGIFTALGYSEEIDEGSDGKAVASAALWMIGVSVLAWGLWATVSGAAGKPHPSFIVLVLDALLSTTWICGIQGVIFGLLPLRFLDGHRVLKWSRWAWGALYLLAMFAFVHTMFHTSRGGISRSQFISALILFAVFFSFSLTFWGYFRFRHQEAPPPGTPPTDPVLVRA